MALCDVGGLPQSLHYPRKKKHVSPEKEGDPPQDYNTGVQHRSSAEFPVWEHDYINQQS